MQQQQQQQKRRNSFGGLFKRVQELYQSSEVTSLNSDEFCKDVIFSFGVPLLIIDLFENLTGTKIVPKLREQMSVNTHVVQVEQYDEELAAMKLHIHEEFYNHHLIYLFNSLGQYEFKEYKQMNQTNIEMIQYLTQHSIQKHFVREYCR